MITSQFLKKSGIEELLKDSDRILKQITALQKQEQVTKEAKKVLLGAQSLKKLKKDAEDSVKEAEGKVKAAEQEAASILHTAKAAAVDVQADIAISVEKAKSNRAASKATRAVLKQQEQDQAVLLAEATALRDQAKADKVTYQNLKEEYETKLADLLDKVNSLK